MWSWFRLGALCVSLAEIAIWVSLVESEVLTVVLVHKTVVFRTIWLMEMERHTTESHLLSIKDLDLSDQIPNLIEAGICSSKADWKTSFM
jgi:hypothetical protein